MLRSILVGLDGSEYAHTASELAMRWAKRYGSKIIGLGIVDRPSITGPTAVPIGGSYYKRMIEDSREEHAHQQVEKFLTDLASRCMGENVETGLIEAEGDPSEEILRASQRCDLTVLGRKTHFHFETQEQCDDTLDRVLRATPRPVVAAPEKLNHGDSIVLAYDASAPAARVTQLFAQSGLGRDKLIHVVSAHSERAIAAERAQIAVDYLVSRGLQAVAAPIERRDDKAKLLVEKAAELNAEMIVMGSHGRSAIVEFFVGSKTRYVLENTTAPVFLYH